jgi:MFS family permease
MAPNRYADLLRMRQVRVVFVAGLLAQLPIGMYSLAVLLLVQQETGSFAAAGLVSGVAVAARATVGPFQGRLVDRFGRRIPLVVLAWLNVLAVGCLVAATLGNGALILLAATAGGVGATIPPIAASQLGLWPKLLRDRPELLDTAAALEVIQLDLFLIVGPLLVTAAIALVGPVAALAVCPLMTLVGTLRFASLPATRAAPSPRPRGSLAGPLSVPGIRVLIATIALTGLAVGVVRIGLIAFGDERGSATAGGLLLATLGVGSLVGGLWYGSRERRLGVTARYVALLIAFAAALAPLALAGGFAVMAALTVLAGLALAPVTVCEIVLLRACSPAEVLTETYAWAITATFVGGAAGSALAGAVVEAAGWQVVLLGASGCLAAAAALATVRRGVLALAALPQPA